MPRPRQDGQPARELSRRRLTDQFIKRVKPEAEVVLHWDVEPRRLALQVQPSGHKSFKLIYSLNGRVRWFNIGDVDAVPLKEARKTAQKLLGEVAKGIDVQAEKRAARQAGTFEELATRYVEEFAKKRNKSWAQADFLVRKYLLPKWGKLSVRDIRRGDVRAIFRKLTDDGSPVLANQVLASASAIFTWAMKNEVADLPANPCRGVEGNVVKSRERVLSDAEVGKFWKAFDQVGLLASSALKMILLTGQRPGEVRHMRREHLEIGKHKFTDSNGRTIEAEGGWWSMPGQPDEKLGWPGTKNAQSHRVWLPEAAVAILNDLDEGKGGFVFTVSHGRPLASLDLAMKKVCEIAGVNKDNRATPHDLRRTYSTMVASLGFTRDALNRVTNHREGGIADVYDRHGYANENRIIAEAVAAKIMGLVEGGVDQGKVIPLHA